MAREKRVMKKPLMRGDGAELTREGGGAAEGPSETGFEPLDGGSVELDGGFEVLVMAVTLMASF